MFEQATPDCAASDSGRALYWLNTYSAQRLVAHAHGADYFGFALVHAAELGRDVWAFAETPNAQ